jgi:hypothetical protein
VISASEIIWSVVIPRRLGVARAFTTGTLESVAAMQSSQKKDEG